ncbi:MAG: SMP-30/gluconolactonase/LRE family protein [Verrucomicrobiales bacterium]|nr:SMP-30/gluconolactonase/LRE family protein [Verrucomicrobiales bacterium]MCP5559264.1 SMP-30/gluconolactonase/LRE family protein [Verrucomicrobiaceae bacterium]
MIKVEPVGQHVSQWGEGPIWHRDRLLYVDIEDHKIISFSPKDGSEKIWDVGQRVGTVVPRQNQGLVWAGDDGFYFFDEVSGISSAIGDPERELPDNRFNDGKCDPAGRLWAGTICLQKRPDAALYCLHADLRVEKKFGPVTNSNGIIWSYDSQTMYYIDTPSKKVRAFDFNNATSDISGERVIWDTAEDPSSPDGMTIDANGNLWIAFCHGAKVVCFNPSTHKVEEEITFPCVETTACAFGGPDLADLYVTTGIKPGLKEDLAGRLFVCRPGVSGVPSSSFAG